MKVVIVMPYFDRQAQLTKTLLSFQKSFHKDFEVVIIDDKSPKEVELPELNYPVTLRRIEYKQWHNPDPVYNIGLKIALNKGADIIIIQNPECYHVGDIISFASRIDDFHYVTFSCFSLSKESTEAGIVNLNNKTATRDGEDAWYNHPVYRPVAYEFCAAITADNIRKLNGYDERMMLGWGYSDNYFLHRTKVLGLKTEIIAEPYVIHQWHYDGIPNPERKNWIRMNERAYNELKSQNIFVAKHLITEDL
jgi:glycosyltransferase involved in cell wall biosynthesis